MFVEIPARVNPFEFIVILPIFVEIAFEIVVAPLLETVIFPLLFVTVPDIAARPELLEIDILPVSLETAPEIFIAPEVFTIFMFPVSFEILPEIAVEPELFEILILPDSFEIAFDIVKPFNDDISIPLFSFETVPLIVKAVDFSVFLIVTPLVAETPELSVNVKLPFLFSILII